jgi:predicted secreted protein
MRTLAASTPRTLAVIVLLGVTTVAIAVGLFGLSIIGGIALYFVVWWTLLFAILPLRNQAETDPDRMVPGQDPGAPATPRLREKAIWTSLVASLVFVVTIAVLPLAGL